MDNSGQDMLLSTSGYKLFVFDTETTDIKRDTAAIIEIAVKDFGSGNIYTSLVRPNPYKQSVPEAERVHGITPQMLLESCTPELLHVWKEVVSFIQERTPAGVKPVLTAYNGLHFDFHILARNLYDVEKRASAAVAAPADLLLLDPWELLHNKRHLLPWHLQNTRISQATIYKWLLGHPPKNAHRAVADVEALGDMLPPLLQWVAAQEPNTTVQQVIANNAVSYRHHAISTLRIAGMVTWQEECQLRHASVQPAAPAAVATAVAQSTASNAADTAPGAAPAAGASASAANGAAAAAKDTGVVTTPAGAVDKANSAALETALRLESQDANAQGAIDAAVLAAITAADDGCMPRLESQDANAAVGEAALLVNDHLATVSDAAPDAAAVQEGNAQQMIGHKRAGPAEEQQQQEKKACKEADSLPA